MPRFDRTFCSQCGREFGPGDNGFSHCDTHPGYKRDRKLARSAAAIKAAAKHGEDHDPSFASRLLDARLNVAMGGYADDDLTDHL